MHLLCTEHRIDGRFQFVVGVGGSLIPIVVYRDGDGFSINDGQGAVDKSK